VDRPVSGISGFDELIDGLRVGDNVVWQAPRDLWDRIATPFVRASRGSGFCYVCFDVDPEEVIARSEPGEGFRVLDCYTTGAALQKGTAAPELRRMHHGVEILTVADARDYEAVQVTMKELEDDLGRETGYAFESLTGMQKLWGEDAALWFFLRHGPRLYELDTVAYWFLDPPEHDQKFLQRLEQITQVVLDIREDGDALGLRISKADARPAEVTGRTGAVEEDAGRLRVEADPPGAPDLGESLRRSRLARGMSQADLARRIGVTPSALSQTERGRRGLSAGTLAAARRELGIAEDAEGEDHTAPSYVLARRGERITGSFAPGVQSSKVIERPGGFEVHTLAFAPGAGGRRPLFATKRPEFVMVTEGVLQLRIGDSKEVLHAGDGILISGQLLSGWRNPGRTVARATWTILP
jgi:transcriptional regulator with XRE-family HTH domain